MEINVLDVLDDTFFRSELNKMLIGMDNDLHNRVWEFFFLGRDSQWGSLIEAIREGL